MQAVPSKVLYDEPHATVPKSTQTMNTISTPVNGSTFTPGQQIWVDLPARGFLAGETLTFRYKALATCAAANATSIIGCPAYAPFARLETYCGSSQLEIINQYNQVETILSNLTLGVSDKVGLQTAYGYNAAAGANLMTSLDGRLAPQNVNDSWTVSAPIHNVLSLCEKNILLFATGSIRLIFTFDALTNISVQNAGVLTGFTISNFELCYELVDMPAVESMVRQRNIPIYLKSMNTLNQAQTQDAGVLGTQDYVYNVRAQSVNAAFLHCSGTAAGSVKKWADSFDVTQATLNPLTGAVTNGGEYSMMIGNIVYPSHPMSTVNNKAEILQELRKATTALINSSTIFERDNSFCIDLAEFSYVDDGATATTLAAPSKFIVGWHLEALHLENALLSGISTQNTPITVRISMNTATQQAHNLNLILFCDSLIEIDPQTGNTTIKI